MAEIPEIEADLFETVMLAIRLKKRAHEKLETFDLDTRSSLATFSAVTERSRRTLEARRSWNEIRLELAGCLSALSSLKLSWATVQKLDAAMMRCLRDECSYFANALDDLPPFPQRPRNASQDRRDIPDRSDPMSRLFKWFNRIRSRKVESELARLSIATSQLPDVGNIRNCRVAFEAVVDTISMYTKIRQISLRYPHWNGDPKTIKTKFSDELWMAISLAKTALEQRFVEGDLSPPGDSQIALDGIIRSATHELLGLLQTMLPTDAHGLSTIYQATRGTYNGMSTELATLTKDQLPTGKLQVLINWELGDFINQCLDGDGDLSAVLTVTGNSHNAYSTTCKQYISWQWGDVGIQVLNLFSSRFHPESDNDSPIHETIDNVDLQLSLGRSSCEVNVLRIDPNSLLAGYHTMVAISVIQVLAWMASVFRLPKEGRGLPHCSSLDINYGHPDAISIGLGSQTPTSYATSKCWHDLLPNTTVATGFPTRLQASGLDIDLDVMFDLADIMFHTDLSQNATDIASAFKGGLFYSGVGTILYPVSKSSNFYMWHFDSSGKNAIPPPDHFLPVASESSFKGSRHVVGFARSKIQLGTHDRVRDYARMSSVVGSIERGQPEFTPETIGFTFGKAPMTATIGGKIKYPAPLRATVDPEKRRYDSIIKTTEKQAVIVYDCGMQAGAFLVSQLSVMLDLVGYRLHKEGWARISRSAVAQANGGAAAAEVLKDPMVYEQKLSRVLEDDSDYTIIQLVKEIYVAMSQRRILQELPARATWKFPREHLHGWDLLEMADAPEQSFRREISVHKTTSRAIAQYPSWLPLARHVPVYLGRDLGNLITIDTRAVILNLPHRGKYLMTNMHLLRPLLKDTTGRDSLPLHDELVWTPSPLNGADVVHEQNHHYVQTLNNHGGAAGISNTNVRDDELIIFGPEKTWLSSFNERVDALNLG